MRLRRHLRKARFRVATRFGKPIQANGLPPATVIVLSYARPRNMAPLVRAVLQCGFVSRVVLSNNNPEISIRDWVRIEDERLEVIDQPVRRYASYRMELARSEEADHYIWIDDDVFLYPEQLHDLYERYLEDPAVPHGVQGTYRRCDEGARRFQGGISGIEGPVDILNRVYLFSRACFQEMLRLREELGAAMKDAINVGDDVVLSFSGPRRPLCHDVGPLVDCPTFDKEGIALFKTVGGFTDRRTVLYDRLEELKPRA